MKRTLTSWMLLLPLLTTLSACTIGDQSSVIADVQSRLQAILPAYINGDYELPSLPDVDIRWSSDRYTIQDNHFDYESPFVDEVVELKAHFSKGLLPLTATIPLPVIAADSGKIIPTLEFDLPGSINEISRETYLTAQLTVKSTVNEDAMTELSNAPVSIRGRGNSTWWVYPKKPYRFRFPTNTSILGMKAARNYVLLAEHADRSFVRNVLTQKLASQLDHIPYALETRFVNVYFNGEYNGLYVLTEQVELHNNRYNVDSTLALDDAGFLMELDWRMRVPESTAIVGQDFINIKDYPYVFQEPEMTDTGFGQRHVNFMTSWIENLEMTMLIRQGYDRYADIDNWIDYFLVQEIVKNVDVGWSSFFFVKPTGGPIQLGPLWDFDFAYGNADYIPYGPEGFWGFVNYKNHWFTLLMENPELRARFVTRFNEIKPMLLNTWIPLIDTYKLNINEAARTNFEKWNILNTYLWPTPGPVLQANTHSKQMDYVKEYLLERIAWMDSTLNHADFMTTDFTDY